MAGGFLVMIERNFSHMFVFLRNIYIQISEWMNFSHQGSLGPRIFLSIYITRALNLHGHVFNKLGWITAIVFMNEWCGKCSFGYFLAMLVWGLYVRHVLCLICLFLFRIYPCSALVCIPDGHTTQGHSLALYKLLFRHFVKNFSCCLESFCHGSCSVACNAAFPIVVLLYIRKCTHVLLRAPQQFVVKKAAGGF